MNGKVSHLVFWLGMDVRYVLAIKEKHQKNLNVKFQDYIHQLQYYNNIYHTGVP